MAKDSADRSVVTSLAQVNQQRLDAQLRQLEFHALLHRKLDLELLLECFISEAQAFLRFDGLQYLAADRGMDILLGDMRQYRQRFELKLGERLLGDLVLMRGTRFAAREERATERLIESLIYPLDNALEHNAALMQSMTDRATGLQNQLALQHQLPREIRLARRGEQPLSIMLLTVDYLESISEHHGTQVGEQAWQSVADALTERLRQSDVIFRTDQDEFLVILNHTDIDGALALADRLRKKVDRCVSYDNVQFVLTASAGVTQLSELDDSTTLMTRVAEALSTARQAGRNQVHAMLDQMGQPSTHGLDPEDGSAA